ncbi:MAG: efflux RND transporter periplasmic adaptor subunit [Pirellulales bacterium]|nr:efflux RND transporter periplasmic adaptor subunit [Pirellulales bacterium]
MIEAPAIPSHLLDQTRKRIEGGLAQLAQLARRETSSPRFYADLLRCVVSSLAALDGAVWTADRQQGAKVAHRLRDELLSDKLAVEQRANIREDQRRQRVEQVLDRNEAVIIDVNDEVGDDDHSGNFRTSDLQSWLVILAPISGRHGPLGVLEIQQRCGAPRATRQGNLRYCERAAAIAADYEQCRRLASLENDQQATRQSAEFIAAVYGSLSVKETSARVANEARRFADADRVTVLVRQGKRFAVAAISGADSFNPRSEAVGMLRRLAERVPMTGQVIAYSKDQDEQISSSRARNELQSFAENATLAGLAVVPLDGKAKDSGSRSPVKNGKKRVKQASPPTKPIGVAIVEYGKSLKHWERLDARMSVVREHGGRALSNAIGHENAVLLPWRRGKAGSVEGARTRILPRWLTFLLVVGGISAAMALIPAEFTLEARGTLEPTIRRNVFASANGVVQQIFVQHGQQVSGGELLAELVNVDLEVELAAKQGELAATVERQSAVRDALLNSARLHASQRDQLTGEAEQLRRTKESLERQLNILDRKLAQNQVLSPITGEVVTWDVEELLVHRPVREGQKLLTVADQSGSWELELQLPEARLGHLLEAQRQSDGEVVVEFILATEPRVTYRGAIKEIHRRAEIAGAEGNSVLIKVAADHNELEQLHPGASVVAKFHCGERSLGYVLFRDVVEFAQRSILFRF